MEGSELVFDIPRGEHVYATAPEPDALRHGPTGSALPVRPGEGCELTGRAEVEGGPVTLWMVEYAGARRVSVWREPLRQGQFAFRWRWRADVDRCVLALRLSGTGATAISNLQVGAVSAGDEPARRLAGQLSSEIAPTEHYGGEKGDAHVYLGQTRTGDPLLAEIGPQEAAQLLSRGGLDRVLAMAHGSRRAQDTFDQIAAMGKADPRITPLFRSHWGAAREPGVAEYHVDQLELLWQLGEMAGLKVHLGHDEAPPPPVLDWAERRGVITMWHVRSVADLEWVRENALSRPSLPVLLSHFAGYPADRTRYKAAIALLDDHPELYLVTSAVWFGWYLREACERHPEQVLLGSDYPAVEPSVALAAIAALDLDDQPRSLVEGENLRFLVERTNAIRARVLEESADLRFPAPPRDAAELDAQGFVVVEPADLPAVEGQEAKRIWADRGVTNWYRDPKPYAHAFVELVRDLAPASVLEFGCNVGRNLASIAEALPDTTCVGIDVNSEAVEAGRTATGLDLRHGDERTLAELDPESFDLVFTLSVLDHIPDIGEVCRELVRCARRHVVCVEVQLPTEGKVVKHLDHRSSEVASSTAASYSWHVARRLEQDPRAWRVESRPTYLHAAALGPYYATTVAFLE